MRDIAAFGRLFANNAQCVLGASIGLVSIFLPWLVLSDTQRWWLRFPAGSDIGSIYEPILGSSLDLLGVVSLAPGTAATFCTLFALGVIFSFYTPLGGIVEGVGLAGFAYIYAQSGGVYSVAVYELSPIDLFNEYPRFIYFDASFVLGVGYLLGVVSSFIVLSSTSAAVRDAREGPMVHARTAALAWNTTRRR